MINPKAVTVRLNKASKLVQKSLIERGMTPIREYWEVKHWGKFKRSFELEADANEYAERLRRKLDHEKWEREDKRRREREHWDYLRREQQRTMQKTNINPIILQPFLESASNAADKGQAQFFTPIEWGQALSLALPRFRPVVVDLSCGAGHLLQGAARGSTNHLLGCDIDPCPLVNDKGEVAETPSIKRVVGDVTKLLPLMREVDFQADCFVLNPAWDLHQYRVHLGSLMDSDLATVRAAFAAHDGRTAIDTIDSTVASLCMALDRCSSYGEGFLIGNEATLQRLILRPGAPHGALAIHVWSHLVIQGNPMTGLKNCDRQDTFQTGVIHFARGHDTGTPAPNSTLYQPPLVTSLEQAKTVCEELHRHRLELRLGPEIKSYLHTDTASELWQALTGEWERLTVKDKPQWNLTIRADGTIKTDLSLFDNHSGRVKKDEAAELFHLEGKHPMQLVMQREQRAHLERAAFGHTWRVDPRLQEAVKTSVAQYHAVRAPLYPLTPVMRLGYLDECDRIVCSKDLGTRFRADQSYAISSTTVAVRRTGTKLNLQGEEDDVEWDGQELAFWITDSSGMQQLFMESRLRAENVRISILRPGEKPGHQDEDNLDTCHIDWTLNDLVDHFVIPDVPDVARVNPDGYQRNLKLLEEIEELTTA